MRSEGRETESSPKSSQESRRAISDSSCSSIALSFCGLDPEGKDFVRNQNIYFYDLKKQYLPEAMVQAFKPNEDPIMIWSL
jgi:hypothetical protein